MKISDEDHEAYGAMIWAMKDRSKEMPGPHTEGSIEQEIRNKGKTAARVTPEDIDSAIVSAQYHIFPGTTLTVCALTLRNGYIVTGESACVIAGNFDEEIGRKIAWDTARQKIWTLEGYLLRQRLYEEEQKNA